MTPNYTDELALITKLRSLGVMLNAFDGLNTPDQRREIVRAALMPVDDVTYAIRNGKRITIAMRFAEVYGMAP